MVSTCPAVTVNDVPPVVANVGVNPEAAHDTVPTAVPDTVMVYVVAAVAEAVAVPVLATTTGGPALAARLAGKVRPLGLTY
jgi:hypothetical protein